MQILQLGKRFERVNVSPVDVASDGARYYAVHFVPNAFELEIFFRDETGAPILQSSNDSVNLNCHVVGFEV